MSNRSRFACLFACCLPGIAGINFSNGAPDNVTGYGISASRTADDFTLGSAATIAAVRFWWGPTTGGQLSDFNGTITYAIYQNVAGGLGPTLSTGTVSGLTSTPTGGYRSTCGGPPNCANQIVEFNLVTPLSLQPGTYWLELHEGNSLTANDGTSTFWATSAESGNAKQCLLCFALPTDGAGVELAFQVLDARVPEAGSIPFGSVWKYLVTSTSQGTAWRAAAFNDSAWPAGVARFGYGDVETTTIGYGPDPNNKYITTYFRKTFTVTSPTQITALVLSIVRDDGAVVYLNGAEVVRSNMPSGTIAYGTLAVNALGGDDETAENLYSLNPALLVAGANVLAVEIHQSSGGSSDVGFDLKLTPSTTPRLSGLKFVPLNPCRLVDTRAAYAGGRTGTFGPPLLNAREIRTIPITRSATCSVPATAKAYLLNLTLDTIQDQTGAVDCVTLWPSAEPRPDFCTARTSTGGYIANAAIVTAGAGGAVDAFSSERVNLILDINGYFTDDALTPGLLYYPVNPCRAVDTRSSLYTALPPPYGNQRMQQGENRTLRLPGSPGCQLLAAAAYSLQLTLAPGALTNGNQVSFITAYPAGVPQPNISNMNAFFGYAVANSAIVPASANGSINVYANDPTNLIIDVNGYFAQDDGSGRGLLYYPVPQCRVTNENDTPISQSADRTIAVPSGRCPGLPTFARAWALNAAVLPGGTTVPYVSMWPSGTAWPNISQLNAIQGQTLTNSAIVPASSNGSIDVRMNGGPAPLVLEVNGYFGR